MITWNDILQTAETGNAEPTHRVNKTLEQWQSELTEEQFYIARQSGTERPFTNDSCALFTEKKYSCVCCNIELFETTNKFDSGSGWPSFTQPITNTIVAYTVDKSLGMTRVEVTCNICDAHLGHVFPDGPQPSGLRYCINGAILTPSS